MKLAILLLPVGMLLTTHASRGSEASSDPETAIATMIAGFEQQPTQRPLLFQDAIQTNPEAARSLFVEALERVKHDPAELTKVIYAARLEFAEHKSELAETALSTVPEQKSVIRESFFADAETMRASLELTAVPESQHELSAHGGMVHLPEEAHEIDEDIREAIARTTAKVEGKLWPEQEVEEEPLSFKIPDKIRVTETGYYADESSLENSLQIDTVDERDFHDDTPLLDDRVGKPEVLRLDESKFASQDTRVAREARKRVIAPAGAVNIPRRPILKRSSVYYIPPAKKLYHSTMDVIPDDRPALILRSVPESPTTPQ